jgi:predicted transcriptional regulator
MMKKELTNKEQVLLLLAKRGRMNTAQIAREMGKQYIYIRNLLYDCKREGLVENHYVKRYVPNLAWVLFNEWEITDLGKKWLKERDLL